MKRGLEWYKREPRAIIDGKRAAQMSTRQAAVYDLLIDLIYEGGGETPDAPKYVAGHFSDISTAAARRTIQSLIEMGKIIRRGSMLTQKRAENESKTRQKLSENRSKTGKKGAVSRWNLGGKSNENNDPQMAIAITPSMAEKEKEEEKEEKKINKRSPSSILSPLLGEGLAADLVEHRQRLRKPLTERAANLLCNKLERCADPKAAAETMIEKGWQSIEPAWMENVNGGRNGKPSREEEREGRLSRQFAFAESLDRKH